MNNMIRRGITCAFFLAFTMLTFAQTKPPVIDESSLLTTMLTISENTPAQAENSFLGKKYTLFSRAIKDMGGYLATTSKYKTPDNTDYFTLITLKETIISTMYITHSKEVYQKTLDEVLKMGYKEVAAVKPDPAQTVYEKNHNRFLVRVSTATDKPLYVMAANNVLTAGRAIVAEKAANKSN